MWRQASLLSRAALLEALQSVAPSSQRGSDVRLETPTITYDDIGGLTEVKEQLIEAVEWPLRHAAALRRIGAPRPRGVLLHGPPGCAKTTLVRAAAAASRVNFLCVSAAQLYSPYQGQSEKNIAQVFDQARAGAPSILFIDEIDSVVGSRSGSGKNSGIAGGGGVNERVMTTLLNQMDGIGRPVDSLVSLDDPADLEAGVLVVAATNRLDMIDRALLRPGRMDRIIYVPLPDYEARLQILELYTRGKPIVDLDLSEVARRTGGFTGADIESLCREACLKAVSDFGFDCVQIHGQHFYEVLDTFKPSLPHQ